MEFKDIFSELRKEMNYSQRKIAEVLSVSQSTVAMWETGKRYPQRETMEQIADLFNVDMDYIYGKTDVRRRVTFDSKGDGYVYVPAFEVDHLELIDLYSKLTKEQKQTVMNMLRSFVN